MITDAKKDNQAFAVINMLYMSFQNQNVDLIEFVQRKKSVGQK